MQMSLARSKLDLIKGGRSMLLEPGAVATNSVGVYTKPVSFASSTAGFFNAAELE